MAWGEDGPDGTRIHHAFMGPAGTLVGFSSPVAAEGPVESLVPALPAIHWDEREMQDLLGIPLEGHPDPRRLLLPDGYEGPPPLAPGRTPVPVPAWQPRVLHHHGIVHLPVGPVHAGIIETGHFVFSNMGETILQMDLRLGWDHRGLEAALGGMPLSGVAAVVERTCGNCSASHQEAFAQAVEAIAPLDAHPHVAWVRGLIAELERIYNHLNDLGQLATGVGLAVLAQQGLELKERALRLNAAAFGHRYLFGAIRPGWARYPRHPDGLARELAALARDSTRWADRLFSNVGFLDRTRGAGRIDPGAAATLGAVGPIARASGVMTDVRWERPTGAYRDAGVTPITHMEGDVLARAQVRREELLGAFRLAVTFLAKAQVARPGEPGASAQPPVLDSALTGWGLGMTESPRGATLHALHLEAGRVVRYHMRTASFTDWPLIMMAVQDNPIGDFPLINKSFELCYACSDR